MSKPGFTSVTSNPVRETTGIERAHLESHKYILSSGILDGAPRYLHNIALRKYTIARLVGIEHVERSHEEVVPGYRPRTRYPDTVSGHSIRTPNPVRLQ